MSMARVLVASPSSRWVRPCRFTGEGSRPILTPSNSRLSTAAEATGMARSWATMAQMTGYSGEASWRSTVTSIFSALMRLVMP